MVSTLLAWAIALCCSEPDLQQVYRQAGIPSELWKDYTYVAACESGLDLTLEGDGGLAQGLLQVHWVFWAEWANLMGYGPFRYSVDPVENVLLAYTIQQKYSAPRHQERWHQWSSKPYWASCQIKARVLLEGHDEQTAREATIRSSVRRERRIWGAQTQEDSQAAQTLCPAQTAKSQAEGIR